MTPDVATSLPEIVVVDQAVFIHRTKRKDFRPGGGICTSFDSNPVCTCGAYRLTWVKAANKR
jgi:hypothetical protein